jgi:hypothetical protein
MNGCCINNAFFNFPLKYVARKVQRIKKNEINGLNSVIICSVVDVNLLGENNGAFILHISKEVGLELNKLQVK